MFWIEHLYIEDLVSTSTANPNMHENNLMLCIRLYQPDIILIKYSKTITESRTSGRWKNKVYKKPPRPNTTRGRCFSRAFIYRLNRICCFMETNAFEELCSMNFLAINNTSTEMDRAEGAEISYIVQRYFRPKNH